MSFYYIRKRARRDVLTIASSSRSRFSEAFAAGAPAVPRAVVDQWRTPLDFGELELSPAYLPIDRRAFIPSAPGSPSIRILRDYEPYKRFSGRPARVVAAPLVKPLQRSKNRLRAYSPKALFFSAPSGVAVCVRRNVRKEVAFAKGFAGTKVRRGRRSWSSNVRC